MTPPQIRPEALAKLDSQRPRADLVYEVIRDNIVSGLFAPGTWLRQEDLAQQLGVSHTPIRQAMERLTSEGLAERVPYHGVRVSSVTKEEIAEVYGLRLLLEPIIVRLATRRVSEPSLADRLRPLINQAEVLVTLDDMLPRRALNREFHMEICHQAASPILERLYEIVWNRFPDWMLYEGMFRQPETREERQKKEIDEHRELINAIAARDAHRAECLASEHIRGFFRDDLIDLVGISTGMLEAKLEELSPHASPADRHPTQGG